jgi:glucose-6-phosphate 1-dehydrogenase
MNPKIQHMFIIFGATGDLYQKKLLPALKELYDEGVNQDDMFYILGCSSADHTDESYRDFSNSIYRQQYTNDLSDGFINSLHFLQMNFLDVNSGNVLADYISITSKNLNVQFEVKVFVAVLPSMLDQIIDVLNLLGHKISLKNLSILFEKPIGLNQQHALKILGRLEDVFNPENLYFVDHYLKKPIFKFIDDFKYGTLSFNNFLDKDHVEEIIITINESMTLEGRGKFYDEVGALKDMGQSHILQILTQMCCEFGPMSDVKSTKISFLKELVSNSEIFSYIVKQYQGYRNVPDVDNNSSTPTFFEVKGCLSGQRWDKTKFSLSSGKAFREKNKFFQVNFKGQAVRYDDKYVKYAKFYLDESIFEMCFEDAENMEPIRMEIDRNLLSKKYVFEYKSLFKDVINKDHSDFISSEEILLMWKFTEKCLRYLDQKSIKMELY